MDEAAFRELISGNRRGLVPGVMRCVLTGLSFFYRLAVSARNRAFDLGLFKTHRAQVPVVSVGNITTGGTGKTPLVAFLTRWFGDKGVRVVLLSRGYRSLPGEVNDEKLLLDGLCPGVPHLQDPNRVQSAGKAFSELGAELLILDDGFQHRRLARDLNIVLIDGLNPWGYGHLLPRGLLRESRRSLQRADLIVLTRADQCSNEEKQTIFSQVNTYKPNAPCVEVAFPAQRLVNADGETTELNSLAGKPIAAFCGIGNPNAFRELLHDQQYLLRDDCFHTFPDHHHYTAAQLDELGRTAKERGLAALLTTQKDLVKIDQSHLEGVPLWAVEIGADIQSGNDLLEKQLGRILQTVKQ